MENQPGITRGSVLVEGFIAGSLIGLGGFSGTGPAMQTLMMFAGIFIGFKVMLPSHMDVHSMSMMAGVMTGFMISVFSVVIGASWHFSIAMLVSTVMIYTARLLKHFNTVKF